MRSVTAVCAIAAAALLSGCNADNQPATPAPTPSTSASQPSAASRAVPDVRGERPVPATQMLEQAGLRADVQGGTGRGPNGGECMITSEDPAPGTSVPAGTTITLRTGEASGPSAEGSAC
ncbi:PASTA domain-containing protein [Nocardia terpenica]|uniref:PASTA domain-containing protein n=1 Tax=Nocardia terpenica TaxID=455432 RepID=A0A6G9ZAC3_9NOCA|nr:PASTA domain-containing protein [Nocardia terpenica]QIS21963.1 PASTA domain-containing protein [Nocardia terpenica]